MKKFFLGAVLLISSHLFGACSPGPWAIITRPSPFFDVWADETGNHEIAVANTLDRITGNQTIVAMPGTEDCNTISAQMSFHDVPQTKTWLNVRLDHAGICTETTTPYPDTLAAGVCFKLDRAGNGVCVLIGAEIPFGAQLPPRPGGLYSLLYVVQSTHNDWHIVGTPAIFDHGSLQMDVPGDLEVTLFGNTLDASFTTPTNYAEISQTVAPTSKGQVGVQDIHNPNMTCSPHRGPQQVNLLQFTPEEN